MNDIQYRVKPLTVEQEVRIVTDYNAGMPIAEITDRHEISKMTLYRVLKRTIKRKEGGEEVGEQEKDGKQVGNGGETGDSDSN